MDNSQAIIIAFLGLLGTLFMAASAVVVAALTNRAEKRKTAETSLEKALRERLLLRDEVIDKKDKEIEDLKEVNDEQEQTIEAQAFVIKELREQLNPETRDRDVNHR